mgnify:CR=1 FL=1
MMGGRIVFYSPTLTPVGGVVKIFDYMNHARDLGYQLHLVCPQELTDDSTIRDLPQFAPVLDAMTMSGDLYFPIQDDDLVFFSWPAHYQQISHCLPPGFDHHRLIHIVQNVRHGNPQWIGGYATRLLARPLSRIMISHETMEACRRWLNPRSPTVTIVEGHNWEYFARQRYGGLPDPVRVGYTTWKSPVGVEVEELLADDSRFVFRSIRGPAGWTEIAELYDWSDAFMGCPGPEEGFYLVGLEALAAGCLLIMADAVGNRAYARWGENCTRVRLDDAEAYCRELVTMADWSTQQVEDRRTRGYDVLQQFTLDREQTEFARFLERIESTRAPGDRSDRPLEAIDPQPEIRVDDERIDSDAETRLSRQV